MNEDRLKAVESAVAQIERQFGKGSIMRLGGFCEAPGRSHSYWVSGSRYSLGSWGHAQREDC